MSFGRLSYVVRSYVAHGYRPVDRSAADREVKLDASAPDPAQVADAALGMLRGG